MGIVRKTFGQQIADALRELIRTEYKPGDRLPSVDELAARYEVSTVPVRDGLLALAHEGLVIRKRRWGTFVAEPAPDNRHVAIFSELDTTRPRCSHFFRRVPQALRAYLLSRGIPARAYIGLLTEPEDGGRPTSVCEEFFHDLEADRLSGVIEFNSDDRLRPRLHAAIAARHLPHVLPSDVQVDSAGMLAIGLGRLRELGCRRVAVLGAVPFDAAHTDATAHEATLTGAFAVAGPPYRPEWCRGDLAPKVPGAGWEMFREIWAARAEKPDGLLVTDDVLFSDVAKAILAMRIAIPDTLRVVTHSNKGSGLFYPFPVDRLEVDPDAFADACGARMVELLQGRDAPATRTTVQARLIAAEESENGGAETFDANRLQSTAIGSNRGSKEP